MTIYVDDALIPYRGSRYSHMMTDGSMDELHKFAQKLGLKREWFQGKGTYPHYDVSENKRKVAISMGAVAVASKDLVIMARMTRKGGSRNDNTRNE